MRDRMKDKLSIYKVLAILVVTVLFYFDFFLHNLNSLIFWLLLSSFALLMTFDDKWRKQREYNRFNTYFFPAYVITLLILFSIFGDSERGFSITESGFWIILVVIVIDARSYKNNKREAK
jgi:amino acid transporter